MNPREADITGKRIWVNVPTEEQPPHAPGEKVHQWEVQLPAAQGRNPWVTGDMARSRQYVPNGLFTSDDRTL